MKSILAKIALWFAGDSVKKALVVLGACALAYKANYPATELSRAITEYVLPILGLAGITSGGVSALQPPAVSAAVSALTAPTAPGVPAPDLGGNG